MMNDEVLSEKKMVDNINLEANNQLTNVEQPEIDSVHIYQLFPGLVSIRRPKTSL